MKNNTLIFFFFKIYTLYLLEKFYFITPWVEHILFINIITHIYIYNILILIGIIITIGIYWSLSSLAWGFWWINDWIEIYTIVSIIIIIFYIHNKNKSTLNLHYMYLYILFIQVKYTIFNIFDINIVNIPNSSSLSFIRLYSNETLWIYNNYLVNMSINYIFHHFRYVLLVIYLGQVNLLLYFYFLLEYFNLMFIHHFFLWFDIFELIYFFYY